MRRDLAGALARQLERRGLAAPARLLLDAHRPLAALLSEAATFLSPITDLLAAGPRDRLGPVLADPDAIDGLVSRLKGD
jgi:hypothetical protein